MKRTTWKHSFLLFLAALIWGVAFVAQSAGMDYVGPCTFNAARFLIGGTVLLPLIWYRKKKAPSVCRTVEEKKKQRRITAAGGVCCGLAICSASLCQQFGILYTTVGKAGFITALYIVMVPVLGLLFGRKVQVKIWFAAAVAALGLYLLCMNGSFSINKGDALVLLCALLFSVHIMVIDHFSPKADGVQLSCIQFYVSGLICTVAALLFEHPSLAGLLAGWMPILYAGVMSCGIAYTLQIVGQKHVEPTVASLILSLESVVSVLAGWAILGQRLSDRELFGCFLVFGAVILVQLPGGILRKSSSVSGY